jgi:hypothetical protein
MQRSIAILSLLAVACSDETRPLDPGDSGNVVRPDASPPDAGLRDTGSFDPICESCRGDGESCHFSSNCQPGSICNLPEEDFYDPTQPDSVCTKVICSSDSDCMPPKVCSGARICETPLCQEDSECVGGNICAGGECRSPHSPSEIATCRIMTPSQPLVTGATVELVALAFNANAVPIPGIPFDWTASDPGRVSVRDSTAIGGSSDGTAVLTATVRGVLRISCTGLELDNFTSLAAGSVRVIAIGEQSLRGLAGAEVTVLAGGEFTATTDARGSAIIQTAAPIESVTVVKAGYHAVTVLAPGARDVLMLSPRVENPSVAGGFGGLADISTSRRADVKMGVAGHARTRNVLDFGISPGPSDLVPTVIDAPELGLNNEELDLNGGFLLGLGTKTFTDDMTHCRGVTPGGNELGCYLVRAPAGVTTGYVFAGELKLSDLTSIANELSQLFSGEQIDPENSYRGLLMAVSPLILNLRHGLAPVLDISEYPLASGGGADFDNYLRANMAAERPLAIHAVASVPRMPVKTGGICPQATLLSVYASAVGRGLVPLGLRAVRDVVAGEAPNCRVGPTQKPFGDASEATEEGEIPVSITSLHGGLEGSELLIAAAAFDSELDPGLPNEGSVLFYRSRVLPVAFRFDRDFLPYPRGTLSRQAARFTVTEPRVAMDATAVRITVNANGAKWLVYAPASATEIDFPAVMATQAILTGSDSAIVQAFRTGNTYAELWAFGSGGTLDRLPETIESLATEDCVQFGFCTLE